MALEILAG